MATVGSIDRLDPVANFFAGAVGGCFDNFVRQPFDTIKVRIQAMALASLGEETPFRNSFDCFHKTLKGEGIRGLYRGITVVILTDAPVSALYFLGASVGRRLQRAGDDESQSSIREHFLAGCFGGAITAALVTPLERVKVLLQVEQTKHLGPIHVGKRLWESGGLRSFYRGTMATLFRDIPGGGVYLGTYEFTKRYLLSFNSHSAKGEFHILPTVIAGGAAGLATCLVEIPPDVIKSRLQSAPDGTYPQGMRSVLRELLRKGSFLSFYRGFTPIALYSFPGSAACMLGYELTICVYGGMAGH